MGRRSVATLLCLAVVAASGTARGQVHVTMRTDRERAAVGEPFTLEVRVEATNANVTSVDAPDLSQFDVLSQRVARPMTFSFGFGGTQQFVQATTVYTYELSARHAGHFTFAPARAIVSGHAYAGNAIAIEITGTGGASIPPTNGGTDPGAGFTPAGPPGGNAPPAGTLDGAQFDPQGFVRTVVDKPRPYVGEQVTVTIYLYVRGGVRSAPVASREAAADGFWVHDLLPPQRTLEATDQMVSGVPFRVYVLRRFAAFPLQPGTLTIGAMHVACDVGSVFDIFGTSPIRSFERDGVPVSVDAQPLPDAGRPRGDVYVGHYTVTNALDRTQAATGDAVTMTATVRGTGNLRDVRLPTPSVDGLTFLEPQLRDNVESPNDLVGGTRVVEWLVVPQRAGHFTIPPLGVATFDPQTATFGRVESTALTLVAAGQPLAGSPGGDTPPPDGATPPPADAPRFGALRGDSALLRRTPTVSSRAFYPWAAGAFPTAFLGLLAFGALRRRALQSRERGAPERLVRSARKRLAAAESIANAGDAPAFYGEVTRSLLAVLEVRAGEPLAGLTHAALRRHLVTRGMADDLAVRIAEELDGADFARFSAAGTSREEMERTMDRVQALLERIDRFSRAPREKS